MTNTPTIQEMNKEIALMLGWKYYPKVKVSTWNWDLELYELEELKEDDVWVINPAADFEKYLCVSSYYYEMNNLEKPYKSFHYSLRFHDSANWQFEAITWIEQQGYEVSIIANECEIGTEGYKYVGVAYGKANTKKEAIFEALYSFSQYLKTQK